MPFVEYKNSVQHIESLSVLALAEQYPTPFYCYSSAKIRAQYRKFSDAFSHLNTLVCFAVKVNSNQAVLSLLAKEGAGADVVSVGEIKRALAANIPAEKIVFSGVAKTEQEMEFALKQHILCFNIESEPELLALSHVAKRLKITANISFRINPNVNANTHKKISTGKKGDKFGVDIEHAISLYQQANNLDYINVTGINMHIGSQISDVTPFDLAIQKIKALYCELKVLNININHVDFGGGLAVKYQDDELAEPELLAQYAAVVNRHAEDFNCRILFEPGRFITANAGVLVSQVIYKKNQSDKTLLIVDAAMNDFIRPTLYDAYHKITAATQNHRFECVDVVGPVCETGDYFALDRTMEVVEQGDLIVINSVGAYSAVASNSYNSRPIIAEIMVQGDQVAVIREAQSVDELIARDKVPSWV
ncbi:diaminopimelate decarboxylase [uncultured Paraglaciecola sp.]|uniref:diaminopimelate decarboxylase n=1 Tax=uncultured Paraglaciecola sp. TaxID=1765024 RepID=UPI0025961F4A|nr:diaminopimelate decarboxylase [uncultured Paraglaciecola sp.]